MKDPLNTQFLSQINYEMDDKFFYTPIKGMIFDAKMSNIAGQGIQSFLPWPISPV